MGRRGLGQQAGAAGIVEHLNGKLTVRAGYDATAEYVATAALGPGAVVGVTTGNEVRWLKLYATALRSSARSRTLPVPSRAVAVVTRNAAHDVAVLFEDGTAARVPLPA